MSEQEREDLSPGEPDSGSSAQADEQAPVWPSPGAMVGITIPEPPDDAVAADPAEPGPVDAPPEPERDEDDVQQ